MTASSTLISICGIDFELSGSSADLYYNNIASQVEENTFLAAAIRSVRKSDGDIIDVGANIGLTTIIMAKTKPSSTVYAVEPGSSAFQSLHKNVKLNNIMNSNCHNIALADRTGYSRLNEDLNNTSAAHLSHDVTSTVGSPTDTEVETLDVFCQKRNITPYFIKIDVEGHEINIINGGIQSIKQFKPFLFIELNSFTTVSYGRRNPYDIMLLLLSHYDQIIWKRGLDVFTINDESDLTIFFHEHYDKKRGVDDIFCIPRDADFDKIIIVKIIEENQQKSHNFGESRETVLEKEVDILKTQLGSIINSRSWRLVRLLQYLYGFLKPRR